MPVLFVVDLVELQIGRAMSNIYSGDYKNKNVPDGHELKTQEICLITPTVMQY